MNYEQLSEKHIRKEQQRAAEERIRGLGKTGLDRDIILSILTGGGIEYAIPQSGEQSIYKVANKNSSKKCTPQKHDQKYLRLAQLPIGMLLYVTDSNDQIADAWRRLEQERAQESEFRERFGLASDKGEVKIGYTLEEAANILQRQGYKIEKVQPSKPNPKKQSKPKPKPSKKKSAKPETP